MIQDTVLQEHQDSYFARAIDRAISINVKNVKIGKGQPSNAKVQDPITKCKDAITAHDSSGEFGERYLRDATRQKVFRLLSEIDSEKGT